MLLPNPYGDLKMDSEDRSTQKDTSSSAVTSSLSDLIARLEKATGPDRELGNDVLLACGWVCEEHGNGGPDTYLTWAPSADDDDFMDGDQPDPTSSIDAAMTLALDGWILDSMSDEATGHVCELVITGCAVEVTNGQFMAPCTAATRPLALAGAWLKARSLPAT